MSNDSDKKVLEKLTKIKIPEGPLTIALKNCFLNKVEYYKNNPDSIDPADFFGVLSHKQIDSIFIPMIFYSNDSSKIFFYVIPAYSMDSRIYYGGFALIGYRNNSQEYEIYPVNHIMAMTMYSYDEAYGVLIAWYQFQLKDETDVDGRKYNNCVGEEDFWTKSLFFTKRPNGLYYFQTYRYIINTGQAIYYEPYNYPKCN